MLLAEDGAALEHPPLVYSLTTINVFPVLLVKGFIDVFKGPFETLDGIT